MTTIHAGDAGRPDHIHVFLDNVELKNCVAVNEEEGWAEVYVPFDTRLPMLDSWPIERRYGQIRVEKRVP